MNKKPICACESPLLLCDAVFYIKWIMFFASEPERLFSLSFDRENGINFCHLLWLVVVTWMEKFDETRRNGKNNRIVVTHWITYPIRWIVISKLINSMLKLYENADFRDIFVHANVPHSLCCRTIPILFICYSYVEIPLAYCLKFYNTEM